MREAGFSQGIEDFLGRKHLTDEADVVIVGTGVAGATAARVLAEGGAEVILIEEGPDLASTRFRRDVYTGARTMWREMGLQAAQGRSMIPMLQGRCVGGSTTLNCAIIHRMPEKIHDVWRREHGVGDLLRYEDLSRAWDRIEPELSVARAPEAILGNNNLSMGWGASALGIASNAIRRSVKDCQGSGRCLQGCPTDRKQGMNLTYIPRALAAGARLYTTCKALVVAREGGRAAGVHARFVDPVTGKRGPTFYARARSAVIVGASALQTPLLLRQSGIGRQSGLVGRRLQAHPGTGVAGIFDKPINMWFGATQGYESLHYWDDRMKFETLSLPPELLAARLPGIGDELMRQLASYSHYALWAVQCRAHAHGRVRKNIFGGTSIDYDPTDEDVRLLKRGVKILTRMMFAAGAREVLPGVHGLPERIRNADPIDGIDALPDHPGIFHCIATHLFGTATMGKDPRTSVVAPDCQSHELAGLYVTDSSCFPTNMGVNPQHSIAAVSWVASERILERIGVRKRSPVPSPVPQAVGAAP